MFNTYANNLQTAKSGHSVEENSELVNCFSFNNMEILAL